MGEWISVKDRIPVSVGRVLVKTTTCGIMVAGRCIPNASPDEWTWGVVNDIEFNQDEVTHWMPLPEPPK